MTNVKLSQIAPSPSNVAATTQFVAVEGGNTDYLFSPSQFINGFGLLRSTVADQTLSGGWNVTAHTYATGNIAIDCGQGPLQIVSNAGAFTITAPGNDGDTVLQITNITGAGTVTFSGFTVGPDTGDILTTTVGSKFSVVIWRINGISSYYIYAYQAGTSPPLVNVMTFGADNTNNAATATTTNAAIQTAINTAAVLGGTTATRGGTVFFPSGTYQCTASFVNTNATSHVTIMGSGRDNTKIVDNVAGFVFTVLGSSFTQISNMTIQNSYAGSSGFDFTVGCIWINSGFDPSGLTTQAFIATNLTLSLSSSGVCVLCGYNSFELYFRNILCSGGGAQQFRALATAPFVSGPIGMYVTAAVCIDCEASGFAVAMWLNGTDTRLYGCRSESSNTGVVINTSATGGVQTNGSNANVISGHSTERCDVGLFLNGLQNVSVDSCSITGTIGTFKLIQTATYDAGSGLITLTTDSNFPLANFNWTSGTRKIIVEGVGSTLNPTGSVTCGYNTNRVAVTATWTSNTTFTYTPVAGDPGSYTGTVGPLGDWSFQIAYGIRVFASTASSIRACTVPALCSGASIDLGSFSGNCTFLNVLAGINAGGTWIMPTSAGKAGATFINSDQPTGADVDAASATVGMIFSSLPGVGTAGLYPPQEGMEYDIIDAPFGVSSQGATLTGVLTSGTLVASSVTGLITPGDSLLASGSLGNLTAGTTIRSYGPPITLASGTLAFPAGGGAGTYVTNTTQTLAGTDTGMSTRYSNFGRILTAGGSSNHCRVRCSTAPFNSIGTISDGTNLAVFTGSVGVANFPAIIANASSNMQVLSMPTGGFLSVGDTVVGTGLQTNTTIATSPGGGVGTYVLSLPATSSRTLTYTAQSSILNVTSAPLFSSINPAASWTCDLAAATNNVQSARTILSQLTGSAGLAGTYSLSGAQLTTPFGPNGTLAAGLLGNVLTLHGTTTGLFAVGTTLRTNFNNAYFITKSLGGSPAQWTVSSGTRFQGAQAINGGLWTVCG